MRRGSVPEDLGPQQPPGYLGSANEEGFIQKTEQQTDEVSAGPTWAHSSNFLSAPPPPLHIPLSPQENTFFF